jgi:hypothetical protein
MARIVEYIPVTSPPAGHSHKACSQGLRADGIRGQHATDPRSFWQHYHRRWQAEDTLENFFRWCHFLFTLSSV